MTYTRYISFVSQNDSFDELPHSLLLALNSKVVEVDPRVVTEDEGWAISFRYTGHKYKFCSRCNKDSEPLECMGWLERNLGFFASLFASNETHSYSDIEPIIQTALSSLTTVKEVEWLSGNQ
jgi:hypothetical protein